MVPRYMLPTSPARCIIVGFCQVRECKDTWENMPVHRPKCDYPADGCKVTACPEGGPHSPTTLRAAAKSVPFASGLRPGPSSLLSQSPTWLL